MGVFVYIARWKEESERIDPALYVRHTYPDMRSIEIKAVVWKEGRHYVSQCLNFDVSSFGSTEAKALANLREALELYLEGKKAHKPTKIGKPSLSSMKLMYA
jgi:predicted RNase H-like HicB family nuclease